MGVGRPVRTVDGNLSIGVALTDLFIFSFVYLLQGASSQDESRVKTQSSCAQQEQNKLKSRLPRTVLLGLLLKSNLITANY